MRCQPVKVEVVDALGEVVLAGVHGAVQVGEELGDGLEPLVRQAGGAVDLLRLIEVAVGGGPGQVLRLGDQLIDLLVHVGRVGGDHAGEVGRTPDGGGGGDLTDAGADHERIVVHVAGAARKVVRAILEVEVELGGGAGRDALALTDDRRLGGAHLELGSRGRRVGDHEGDRAGVDGEGGRVAALVGERDRDRLRAGRGVGRRGRVARRTAGRQRQACHHHHHCGGSPETCPRHPAHVVLPSHCC